MSKLFTSELLSELIKVFGLLGTTVFGFLSAQRGKKVKKAEAENVKLRDNLYQAKIRFVKELMDFQHFSVVEKQIQRLFKLSHVDRFTVLFVVNGTSDFKRLTVVYDQSKLDTEIGSPSPYTNVIIDDRYKQMIYQIEKEGFFWAESPNFGIGSIEDYLYIENIESILWGFIGRYHLDPENDVIVFASLSSTSSDKWTKAKKKKVELAFSGRMLTQLKKILEVPSIEDSELLDNV